MPETVETSPQQPVIAQKPRLRRISEHDVKLMSILAAKRVPEAKACRFLGIKEKTWIQFKARNGNTKRFEDAIACIQTAKIEANWDLIEKAAIKDWRAAREMLSLLLPDTYGDKAGTSQVQVNVGVFSTTDVHGLLVKAYAQLAQAAPKQVQDVKQVADKPAQS